MTDLMTVISTVGFPVVAAVGCFWGCKYMLDNQNKSTDRMFDLYDKANSENREAIKACTEAINKLCDKLEDIKEV